MLFGGSGATIFFTLYLYHESEITTSNNKNGTTIKLLIFV